MALPQRCVHTIVVPRGLQATLSGSGLLEGLLARTIGRSFLPSRVARKTPRERWDPPPKASTALLGDQVGERQRKGCFVSRAALLVDVAAARARSAATRRPRWRIPPIPAVKPTGTVFSVAGLRSEVVGP